MLPDPLPFPRPPTTEAGRQYTFARRPEEFFGTGGTGPGGEVGECAELAVEVGG